jgi:hypothetical protein
MKAILTALAIAGLATAALGSGAVAADQTAPAAAPVTEKSKAEVKKDPTRTVCKKTAITGSRFPTKVCRTQNDWDKQAELDKQALSDAQRGGLASCGTTPCG